MREIKIRAWDKKDKKWLDDYEWALDPETSKGWYLERGEMMDIIEDIIIVQYTGLKDKNGKEIYEGDVVRMKGLIAGHFEPMIGYVYYEPPSFVVIALEPQDVKGKGRLLSERNLNEIIGNLHENPELLGKKS